MKMWEIVFATWANICLLSAMHTICMYLKEITRLHSRIRHCLSRECFRLILKGFNSKNSVSLFFFKLFSKFYVEAACLAAQNIFVCYTFQLNFSFEGKSIVLNANNGRLWKQNDSFLKIARSFCNIVRSFMAWYARWFCHIDNLHWKEDGIGNVEF